MNNIANIFRESIDVKNEIINQGLFEVLKEIGDEISSAIKAGNKIMLCGNGGSAADAQHLAAEMLIRLRPKINREGVAAIALAQDTSTITACGNDFGYEFLYERMVKSIGRKGDCLIGITTSGNSENIILAMRAARKMGIKVYGFLGDGGGGALFECEKSFLVPSSNTARIQESHITAGHALMEYIEDQLLDSEFLTYDKKA